MDERIVTNHELEADTFEKTINKKRICQTLFILHSLSKRKVLGARGKRKPKVSFSPCKSLLKKKNHPHRKTTTKNKACAPGNFFLKRKKERISFTNEKLKY